MKDEAEHSVIVDEDEEDDFETPYPGYEDEDGKKEEENQEEEEKKEEEEEKKEEEGKKEEEKKEEEETALEEPSEIPWEAPKSLRVRSGYKGSAKRTFNVPPGNIIKFRGWDTGTTLKEHTMDHFPEEMDLLDQMIQRAEKLQWAVNPQTVPAENMYLTVPKIDLDTEDCKRYIQKKDIMQMFERFTKVLVHQQPPNPLDVLHGYARDLAEQHRNERGIEDDLSSDRRASQASTSSNVPNKSTRTARLSAEGSRTRYGGPVKITSSYLDRDSYERRSIPEHPTPSQLTMDPEDSPSL